MGFKEPLEGHHLPARVDELLVHDGLLRPQVEGPVKQEGVRAMLPRLLRVHAPTRPVFSSSSISCAIRSRSRCLASSPGHAPASSLWRLPLTTASYTSR